MVDENDIVKNIIEKLKLQVENIASKNVENGGKRANEKIQFRGYV